MGEVEEGEKGGSGGGFDDDNGDGGSQCFLPTGCVSSSSAPVMPVGPARRLRVD